MDSTPSPVMVAGVPIKRPPEDEEPFDPTRAPPKRPTMENPVPNERLSHSTASLGSTRLDLSNKTPGELVSIILQMQSSHELEVANLRDRCAFISRQVEQLTSVLNVHFSSQLTALQSLQQTFASISTPGSTTRPPSTASNASNVANDSLSLTTPKPPILAPKQAYAPTFAPVSPTTPITNGLTTTTTTTIPRHPRLETPSIALYTPSQTPATASVEPRDKRDIKITPSPQPNQPPTVEASHLETAMEAWEEFRYGRNGNPSLETLDAIWGPSWRQDLKLREFYKRRKAIADKIKQFMADGVDEDTAVRALDVQRGKRKLNWLSLRILDERKAQKEQYKEAQKAALANKAALDGMTTSPTVAAAPHGQSSQT